MRTEEHVIKPRPRDDGPMCCSASGEPFKRNGQEALIGADAPPIDGRPDADEDLSADH